MLFSILTAPLKLTRLAINETIRQAEEQQNAPQTIAYELDQWASEYRAGHISLAELREQEQIIQGRAQSARARSGGGQRP